MWTKDLFKTEKPIIAMLHLLPMVTDPKYKKEYTVEKVVERARRELHALQNGGVDGFIFINEFSIPYLYDVKPVTLATMARVIGELKSEIKIPFGVHVAQDPFKTFDLAAAVGADFVRETFFGAYTGDYGLANVHVGELERHRYEIGCENVRTLSTFIPEGGMPLDHRSYKQIMTSIHHNWHPDALLVFGDKAGGTIDNSILKELKQYTDTPIFASNGVNVNTVEEILSISDGAVVGTTFKKDGEFLNEVEEARVKEFMDKVKAFRGDK